MFRCLTGALLIGAVSMFSATAVIGQANVAGDDAVEKEDGIPVTDPLTREKCGACHTADAKGNLSRISWVRTTPEGWDSAIKRMVRLNGAALAPEEARHIVRYLADTHGLAPEEAKPVQYLVEKRLVDETNIPSVTLGQQAKITIDALPDRTFRGHVTEIGNSPIQTASTQAAQTGTQATNFKVVVVLDEMVPDVRPGFTCTADITTATRTGVTAVPIPAVAVREVVYDAAGTIVRPPRDEKRKPRAANEPAPPQAELLPGQTRKEVEGVFVMRDRWAEFLPIKMGIAGEKYFEVLAGLRPGDNVITGPYNAVRAMADGDPARLDPKAAAPR